MALATTVDLLDSGDHACMTFTDQQERLDLVAAFVRDGLRRKERVVCYTDAVSPQRLAVELAHRSVHAGAATARGQLRLLAVEEALLGDDGAAGMISALATEAKTAERDGYPGIRVTADMCWATRPTAAEELTAFETAAADLFTDGRLCVICQYDRAVFDAVTLAFVTATHQKTVAAHAYHDSVTLRICRQYSPPGIRVAGHLDYRHQDLLEQALAESRRLDRHMHVNLSGLDFIDAACTATIVQTALRLPPSRRMTITCRPLVDRMLALTGVANVPAIRVIQAHDQS
jgi:anti-anti-sigma regulatory factor